MKGSSKTINKTKLPFTQKGNLKPNRKDSFSLIGQKKKSTIKSELILAILLAIGISLIIYFQSFSFNLTYFDDDAILLRNIGKFDSLSISDAFVRDAEFRNEIELYRPLQNLSFIADYNIWGFAPGKFHITGFLLHLFSSFLFFLILRRMQLAYLISVAAMLVFISHPLFNISVSWLPARGDMLLAFFGLLAFYFFLIYCESFQKKFLSLSLIACCFALFSKESAIILPILFLIYHLFVLKKKPLPHYYYLNLLILAPMFFLYFFLRSLAVHSIPAGTFGLSAFLANLAVIPETIWYFFIPFEIPVMPFYLNFYTIAGLLISALLLAGIIISKKHKRELIFGVVWFLGLSLPAMIFRPEWSAWCYDYCLHRAYFPLAGLFIGLTYLTTDIKSSNVKWISIGLMGVAVIFTVLSFRGTAVYADSLSLYSHAIKTNNKSAIAWQNMGNYYYTAGKNNDAMNAYNTALALKPDFSDAWFNKGILNSKLKNFKEAISDLEKVTASASKHREARIMIAKNLAELGENLQAAMVYQKLVEAGDTGQECLYGLSMSYFLSGNYSKASQSLERTLQYHPDMLQAMRLSAHIYHINGDYNSSVSQYLKVLDKESNPSDMSNLAYVYLDMKNMKNAEKYFQQSLVSEPDNPDAQLGLSMINVQQNHIKSADSLLKRATLKEPLLSKGMSGIAEMQKQGYSFTPNQIKILSELFTLMKFQKK